MLIKRHQRYVMYIEEIKSHLSSDRPLSQDLDKEPSTQSAGKSYMKSAVCFRSTSVTAEL